jgi:hypothetical protein
MFSLVPNQGLDISYQRISLAVLFDHQPLLGPQIIIVRSTDVVTSRYLVQGLNGCCLRLISNL